MNLDDNATRLVCDLVEAADGNPSALAWATNNVRARGFYLRAKTIVRARRALECGSTAADPVLADLAHEFFLQLWRRTQSPNGVSLLADAAILVELEQSIRAHLAEIGHPLEPRSLEVNS